jgi:hypothetical protein
VYGGQPGHKWTPLTTPAGRPLSVADQRRRTSPQQPLAGGLRLAGSHPAPGERRITLSDQEGRFVRGWRVTSRTQLGAEGATPALVGDDPVVVYEVARETSRAFLYEYEVLRLTSAGGTSQRFAIAPAGRVVWGDVPITGSGSVPTASCTSCAAPAPAGSTSPATPGAGRRERRDPGRAGHVAAGPASPPRG